MRILAWDLETSPNLGWVWSLWNQNLGLSQVQEFSTVISFAARWADQPKNSIEFRSDHHDGHEIMIERAWELLDEADALLSWNGKGFDTGRMNTEFAIAGLPPYSPVKEIDLMAAAKKVFRFQSNKLDHVSQMLGVGQKVSHDGFPLWLACMQGDERSWAKMKRYNEQDVHLLIELHDRLLPWIPGYPNVTLYQGGDCPRCGEIGTLRPRGFRTTNTGTYQRYRCDECQGWATDGKSIDRAPYRSE